MQNLDLCNTEILADYPFQWFGKNNFFPKFYSS